VSVLAGETAPLAIPWTPPEAGDWQLTFVWGDDPEATLAGADNRAVVDLHVSAAPTMRIGQIWQLSNVAKPLPLLVLLFSLGLFASALVLALAWPAEGRR
jgi:hypothetical protein